VFPFDFCGIWNQKKICVLLFLFYRGGEDVVIFSEQGYALFISEFVPPQVKMEKWT